MRTMPTRRTASAVSTTKTAVEVMATARELEGVTELLRPLLKRVIVKQKGEIAVRADMEAAQQIFDLMELGKK